MYSSNLNVCVRRLAACIQPCFFRCNIHSEGSTSCLSGFLPGLTKAVVQQALEKNRNAIQQVFSTSLALLRQWVEPYDRSAEAAAARAQLATHSIEC